MKINEDFYNPEDIDIMVSDENTNEGFDIKPQRKLHYTDAHQNILNTSLDGDMTKITMFSDDLNEFVTVYSIFKRKKIENKKGDSNPVLYALKKEKDWSFETEYDKVLFWRRFVCLLKQFLNAHKNSFECVVVIPSSNQLNKDISNEIKKVVNNYGIECVIEDALRTITTTELLGEIEDTHSYFRDYWNDDFEKSLSKLKEDIKKMNETNKGIFKYHMIDDQEMRKSIINTLISDENKKPAYSVYINNKNVLLIDDSITHGQSIRGAIHAISNTYNPKSVSVLTMFSQLYNSTGDVVEYDLNKR